MEAQLALLHRQPHGKEIPMRKPLLWIASLVLLLAAGGLAPALAGEDAPAAPVVAAAPAAAPALCPAAPAVAGSLTAPEPLFAAAGSCTFHCGTSSCSRDSDCTALPGGNCAFTVCQGQRVGCCFYL
jgi:hypothetical protein